MHKKRRVTCKGREKVMRKLQKEKEVVKGERKTVESIEYIYMSLCKRNMLN